MIIKMDMDPPRRTWQAALCPLKRRDGTMFIGKMACDPIQKALKELEVCLIPYRPSQALLGPISCVLSLRYEYRKSEKKSLVKKGIWIPKVTRPDADNCAKSILDKMTELKFWNDDSQIYELTVRKFWVPKEHRGIEIEVTPF